MPDPMMPDFAGAMVADAGQSPADFNKLFGDPLDDDYRKGLEAKDLGEGSEYLDSLVGPPPQPTGPDLSSGAALGAAATIGKDMTGAFTEAGHWAIGGPMKALQSFLDVGKELATTIGGPRILDKDGNFDPHWQSSDEIKARMASGEITPLQLPNIGGVMDTPETYTAMLLQSLMQFGTGYGAAGKITGISNSFGGALVKGAMSDAGAFHGNEGNAANLLVMLEQVAPNTMGPINDFVNADFLASKETDNNLEGRLKNAMVGVVPNLLIPLVVSGAKLLRAQRVAKELSQVPGAPGQAAIPPVPPSEAIIGAADDPLIARIGQQLGPDDLGVPTHYAAEALYKNATQGEWRPKPPVDLSGQYKPTPIPSAAPPADLSTVKLNHAGQDLVIKAALADDALQDAAVARWKARPGIFKSEDEAIAAFQTAQKVAAQARQELIRKYGQGTADALVADTHKVMADASGKVRPYAEVKDYLAGRFGVDDASDAGAARVDPSDGLPSHSVEAGSKVEPPPPGTVRMYHGGDEQPADFNGGLWFTTDEKYARGYATRDGRNAPMWYVDVPENHPAVTPEWPDQGIKQGFTFSSELDPAITAQRKRLPSHSVEAGSATAPPLPDGAPPVSPGGAPKPFSQEFKFNWSKIETDDDMKMMAGQVMDAFAPELKARGKGVVQTWKETAEKANAVSAIEMLIGEGAAKGKALDAVQLEAAGNIYVSALKDLKAATTLAVSPNAGPEDLMAWDHMLRVFKMAQNLYVPAQAEAGRALNILRKTKGESALYSQELQRMVTAMGGEVTLKAKAAALADLLQRGPQTLTPEVLQKSVTAKTLDTVMEMWKAGLLTGPKTHIVNFMSNSQVLLTTIAERKVAGMIGEIIDPITGVKAEEAAFMAWGQKQHLREAFRVMAKTFKTGQQEWGGNQVEAPRVPMMSSEHWGVPSNSMLGKGIDMMGTVYTLPFRALGASDAFFKELHYGAELKATALRQATEEVSRGKIPPTQFHLRLQELLDNPTQALRAQARDFAAYNTFTNEPGDILKKVNEFRNFDNPAARFAAHFVMPFTNTPGKILGFFVDRSPLGLLSTQVRNEITKGGAARDIAIAKLGLGTIVLGTGYDLAMDGFVTGGGPAKNDNKRQALMRGGWRPWSIKVPTGEMQDDGITPVYVYVPINRFDPAATPLLLGAALAEMTKYTDGKANRQMDEIWAAGTMALADVMMSKTTMMGFANFVEAMSNPSQAADKYMKNAARSLVPAGANWAKEEFTDPVMRQAWDLVSAAQSKVPYLSESVPPRLDMWGREMTKEQILGQPWDALIPSRMSSTKDALPIDRELLRLNKAMRYPSFIPIKGRNIPLDNLPEAQNRLVTLMNAKASDLLSDENQESLAEAKKGHVVRSLEQFENRTLVDALQEMIKGGGPLGEDYLQSTDEDKGDLISSVKSKYEQAARVQVLREFPQIKSIRDSLPERAEKGIEGAF